MKSLRQEGGFTGTPDRNNSTEKDMTAHLLFHLNTLYDHRFFSDLDYFFAKSMGDIFKDTGQTVLASCALVSKFLRQGHVCIDIPDLAGRLYPVTPVEDVMVRLPDAGTWRDALARSALVSDRQQTPLVLDEKHRLYLARYYDFQVRLTQNLLNRVKFPPLEIDAAVFEPLLDRFFAGDAKGIAGQRKAAAHAVLNRFSIITGGPGTGKTYVVNAIQTLAASLAAQSGSDAPVIICAAPTGKAASKMVSGRTIHSVLKPLTGRPGFQHHRDNLLQADLVIIDEASMIDLGLLTRVLEAIPPESSILLVGDKDQLASVQAGSVFADICRTKEMAPFIHTLTHNFRSGSSPGIEALSHAVNSSRPEAVEAVLQGHYPDIVFKPADAGGSLEALVSPYIREGYQWLRTARTRSAALANLDKFRVLCAHNAGEYGTLQINHLCEKILRSLGNSAIEKGLFEKVVMVRSNDYQNRLFNGDTGIVLEKDKRTTVIFRSHDGGIKTYRYADLPGHDTAFAVTVHKSQGSEFDTVLLVIPDRTSRVMTRQLLYTGVTRAKRKVIIVGKTDVIKAAVMLDTKRSSGIADSLGQGLCCT